MNQPVKQSHETKVQNGKAILCRIIGHKYRVVPDNISSKPCDRWDDCDIPEHRIVFEHWICKRCKKESVKRMNLD